MTIEKIETESLQGLIRTGKRRPVFVEIEPCRQTICGQYVTTFIVRVVASNPSKGDLVQRVGEYGAGEKLAKVAHDVSLTVMRFAPSIQAHLSDTPALISPEIADVSGREL